MKTTAEQVLKPIGEIFSVIADAYHEMCRIFQVGYDSFLKPVIDELGNTLSKLWQTHLQPMWSKAAVFFRKIAELLKVLFNRIKPFLPAVKAIMSALGELFAPLAKIIGNEIISGFGRLADAIGMIFDVLSGLLDFVIGVFTGDWGRAWQGIKDAVAAVWNWLKSSVPSVSSMFGNLWSGIKTNAGSAWDGIKNNALSAWNAIKQSAGSLWNHIKANFQADTVVSYFSGIWSRVKSAFSSIGTQIGGAMAASIKSAINSIIDQVQSRVNSGISLINSALRIIGGKKISSLSLPRLAAMSST